ncbi:Ger(x)C family spore germination protein [Neobacillus sedimentimangrovi]|uniref:Ger(X)C family spore germination protein n=1 Tax=Neobacillus sedimentimangrovi TaxID=2699460 RepID=A0ABS8QFA6_9BACI|nr:Ger(x)C family spore germination protein [Neobacillus sedimentimangrovi]
MKIRIILMMLLLILPLSGCWDTNEPERMVYVYGMGIDYKDGDYIAYLQIINLGLLAKNEVVGSSSEVKVEVGHAKGKTVDEAVFNLYRSTQRRIFWGHLSFLIFSEEAMKHGGIISIIDILDRYRETSYRIWVYVTKDPLSRIFKNIPMLGMSTGYSKISDPTAAYEQFSFIEPVDLRRLLIWIHEPGHEANVPLISINNKNWLTDVKRHDSISMDGIAVVTKDNIKGYFTGKNVKGVQWMTNKMKRGGVTVKYKDSTIDMLITDVKAKIKPVVKGEEIQFDIKVKANAVIDHIVKPVPLTTLTSLIEKELKKDILYTYEQALTKDVDIYHLSETAYRKNVNSWKKVQQGGKIPLKKDTIRQLKVKISLDHGGKQRELPTLEK